MYGRSFFSLFSPDEHDIRCGGFVKKIDSTISQIISVLHLAHCIANFHDLCWRFSMGDAGVSMKPLVAVYLIILNCNGDQPTLYGTHAIAILL